MELDNPLPDNHLKFSCSKVQEAVWGIDPTYSNVDYPKPLMELDTPLPDNRPKFEPILPDDAQFQFLDIILENNGPNSYNNLVDNESPNNAPARQEDNPPNNAPAPEDNNTRGFKSGSVCESKEITN